MGYTKECAVASGARAGEVRRVLWIVLFLNLAVAAGKYGYGLLIHSLAMRADGFHSMFDGASNVIGLVGMGLAARPADEGHPYGHGKYETYAAAAIGAMLLFAAWQIASEALTRFVGESPPPAVDLPAFAVMVATLAVNIGVSLYERRRGAALKSDILTADAAHTGSDVLVSVGVIAGLFLVKLGYPRADAAVALFVVAAILWAAFRIFSRVHAIFSDSPALDAEAVCAIALAVDGVKGCHSIRTRGTSAHVFIDLHVQVEPTLTVARGHEIAERVERVLCDELPGVADVIAHLEPMDDYQRRKTERERG